MSGTGSPTARHKNVTLSSRFLVSLFSGVSILGISANTIHGFTLTSYNNQIA